MSIEVSKKIEKIKEDALNNKVPIMQDDGIVFLTKFIEKNEIKSILEIGSAVGYSAISMANVNSKITVTTIERDQERYLQAVKNVKDANLEDRITLIFGDALETSVDGKYDLIFIDAAKAQSTNFFNRFSPNLNDGGYIITDNMNFHGLVFKDESEIESRDLRQLVRKIKNHKEFLIENAEYETEFLDVGDGIAVSHKK